MLQRALPAGFIAPCCRKPNAVSPLQPARSWRISSGAQTTRMDRRTINLPKSGRKVLGTDLNRSEASGMLPLSCQPQETGGEPQHTQGKLRIGRPLRQVFMAGQDDE